MLATKFESLLRNLEPGATAERQQEGDTPLSEMLGALSELMRQQQQLMDETLRMPGGENGETLHLGSTFIERVRVGEFRS